MRLKLKILSSVAAITLFLGASAANAVLLTVDIYTTDIQSSGAWGLVGPTIGGDVWFHFGTDSDHWALNIDPGTYAVGIAGEAASFWPGSVTWDVLLDGATLLSGDVTVGWFDFELFADGTFFEVAAVPEPSSLALIGGALLGFGLFRRRRT